MNTTTYRPRLSPIQPKGYQSQPPKKQAHDVSDKEHAVRSHVRKLCETFQLSATFSEDLETISTLQTPGLIAVQCVLSKDGKAIGIGHGASVVSRINRATERMIFGCFNGALMSAINSACKTLDVLRLELADEQAVSERGVAFRETYGVREAGISDTISDKQKSYLLQLISVNIADEGEREQFAASVDEMTRGEASEAIKRFVR